jgi:hypothetical protein
MTLHRVFTLTGALAGVGVLLIGTGSPAAADNKNLLQLDAICDNGQAVTVELASEGAFPAGLRVVSTTSIFSIHQVTVTSHDTGETFTIKNDDGVAHNQDLVSCSRSGNDYDFTWTGFFTPAA